MAQKCLECLVVDGNYSKARIGALLLGLISIAFLIWLIVLTVKVGKEEDAKAKATQDFEWDKIAVTCSDKEGNMIVTESKDTLDKCKEFAAKDANAKFIFYSDDKDCTKYKGCGKMEISNKTGLTYQKTDGKDGWNRYDMTCGKDNLSFQVVSIVDSLEKCKEEASKSDHGKFIYFSHSSPFPNFNSSIPGCYFYNKCDSTNVHSTKDFGETYERKIKE